MVSSKFLELGMKGYITTWYRLAFKEQMITVVYISKKDQTRKLFWQKYLLMVPYPQKMMIYARNF